MRARLGGKGEGKGRRIYPNRIFRSRRNFHCYAVAPLKKFLTLHGKSDLLDYMVKTRTHGTLTNLCHKFWRDSSERQYPIAAAFARRS